MPFTFLAHQAPVLPLVLLRPRWFDGVALCVGSMAPDLAYLVSGTALGFKSHVMPALLWFCVPATLLLSAVVRRVARPLLGHLGFGRAAALIGPAPGLVITVTSAAIGVASHVLLDSFTHQNGLAVAHLPALRSTALQLGGHPVPVYSLLQHAGSLVLAIVALYCLRALARAAAQSTAIVDRERRRSFARCAALIGALTVLPTLATFPIGGAPAVIVRLALAVFVSLSLAALIAEQRLNAVSRRD